MLLCRPSEGMCPGAHSSLVPWFYSLRQKQHMVWLMKESPHSPDFAMDQGVHIVPRKETVVSATSLCLAFLWRVRFWGKRLNLTLISCTSCILLTFARVVRVYYLYLNANHRISFAERGKERNRERDFNLSLVSFQNTNYWISEKIWWKVIRVLKVSWYIYYEDKRKMY